MHECSECSSKFNEGCIECNYDMCLKCDKNYLNFETNDCEIFCPSNSYFDINNHICVLCSSIYHSGCIKCSNSECLKCTENYLNFDSKKCETFCPLNSVPNDNNHICDECSNIFG